MASVVLGLFALFAVVGGISSAVGSSNSQSETTAGPHPTVTVTVTAHRTVVRTHRVVIHRTVTAKPKPTHAPSQAAPVQHSCTRTDEGTCIQGGEFCRDSDEGRYGYDANGTRYLCTEGHWEDT